MSYKLRGVLVYGRADWNVFIKFLLNIYLAMDEPTY
jgi:hypothetical protein